MPAAAMPPEHYAPSDFTRTYENQHGHGKKKSLKRCNEKCTGRFNTMVITRKAAYQAEKGEYEIRGHKDITGLP